MPPLRLRMRPRHDAPVLIYTDAAFKWRTKRGRECAAAQRQAVDALLNEQGKRRSTFDGLPSAKQRRLRAPAGQGELAEQK